MTNGIDRFARWWGTRLAAYGRYVARTARIKWDGLDNLPNEPTIWYSWHSTNLIALALHHTVAPRPTQAFVPPGIVGTTMAGWLEGAGFIPLLLPKDGTGNASAALKAMIRGLSKEGDVVIAVDGPHGPAGTARPGTFWLGKMTGRPLMPVGFAARPAVRAPRWDRHLIPLPGARMSIVIGKPIRLARDREIGESFLESIRDDLNSVTRRAWEIL